MAKDFSSNATFPLGLRNNNPGNLRFSPSIDWKGQIGSNKGFAVFKDVQHGIRAYAINIRTAIRRGNDTLNKLIPIYAPPSENNTNAYISSVEALTGIKRNVKIAATPETLAKLARGMFSVELGKKFADLITDSDIREGISMMGGGGIAAAAAVGGGGAIILILVLIGILFYNL